MLIRHLTSALLVSLARRRPSEERLRHVRDHRPLEEGHRRKGHQVFDEIDQSKLAADAGIALAPSTLLIFGNPPLGTLFITADPDAGLDWPVRLLVYQDDKGQVWLAYTDFAWIAKRHGIKSRDKEFKMASEVIGSITSSVKK